MGVNTLYYDGEEDIEDARELIRILDLWTHVERKFSGEPITDAPLGEVEPEYVEFVGDERHDLDEDRVGETFVDENGHIYHVADRFGVQVDNTTPGYVVHVTGSDGRHGAKYAVGVERLEERINDDFRPATLQITTES